MSTFKEKYGPIALVAGASEGLGAAWSRSLAGQGLDLVLIARREEPLKQISNELRAEYHVEVQPICCDLSSKDATSHILRALGDKMVNCLVYNAASSYIGPFLSAPASTHAEIAAVNVSGPLQLLHALAPSMLAQRRGAVVLMASLAGFQGSGFLATYAASKAFTRVLAESLWYEWKSKGVDVIACCAGATATPNYIRSMPGKTSFAAPRPQKPEDVVEECLRKLGKVPSFTSGTGNKLAAYLMQHIFSRKKAINVMGNSTREMYRIEY